MRSTTKLFIFCCASLVSALLLFGCGAGGGSTQPAATTTGLATLSWSQVTTYSDDTPLTPAGYKVYYGTSPATYSAVHDVPVSSLPNPSNPTCTISNLSSGTYYFAVSVYDVDNVESSLSDEVSKII
ncbi:MAG: hypothetical protein WC539_09465 [Nitrospirota bacterium]